jgi:hypothetical protein
MVKCKFEHGGYCCNRGAMQYMDKCEKPCDTIIPVTNADRIRAMSDDELCEMLTIGTGGFDCGVCRDSNECDRECELHCAEWLKQPAKGR